MEKAEMSHPAAPEEALPPPPPEDGSGSKRQVTIILESAALETVKTKKGYTLLNCDEHKGLHRKMNTNPSDYRPDITHQSLLTLLDSPLNKAGMLKIYVHTSKNVIIDVNSKLRIPRTYKRFEGLMVQLLHKLRIRAMESDETLLKVVKNPITRYIPPNALVFGTSVTGVLAPPRELVSRLPTNRPLCFVFGAIAHGHIDVDYTPQHISLSQYPLSASVALGRLIGAFEDCWGIL